MIHKEKQKKLMFNDCPYIYLINTGLNITSNFLEQNNPKSKYQCKNELIYIRRFEAVQKTCSHVLSGLETLGFASRF